MAKPKTVNPRGPRVISRKRLSTTTTVPVTVRALMARLNRKLRHDNEVVRSCPEGYSGHQELGHYYVIDVRLNGIVEKDIDLESYGREKGVLRPWERLEKEK